MAYQYRQYPIKYVMRLTYPELGIFWMVDLATWRIHKIAYYLHISYKLCQIYAVNTQNALV